MPTVVFVCTGNICRSPMASALFENMVRVRPAAEAWVVDSAGMMAAHGTPASPNAQVAMKARGLDLSRHKAKPVSHELIASADLVLTMERDHKDGLKESFPERSGRFYMLSEMVGREEDIADPIGGPLEEYEETARQLELILMEGFRKILRLAR